MILNTIMKAMADGYPYEVGEYRPTAESLNLTIPFASAHPKRPAIIVMIDGNFIGSSAMSSSATLVWMFVDFSQFVGAMSITPAYGMMYWTYKDENSTSVQVGPYTPITAEADLNNYATNTQFFPSARNYGSYYKYKVGHGYKWIAIWL